MLPTTLEGVNDRAVPVLADGTARSIRAEMAVIAVPTWSEADVLNAPGWSGLITSVLVQPGDRVKSGQAIVAIDGVTRVAVATPTPFWRDLRLGDEGPDVAMLDDALKVMGFGPSDPDDVFDSGTAAAVSKFADSLGVGSKSGSFDRSWIIWLPLSELKVAVVQVATGQLAPSSGSEIVKASPKLLGVTFLTETDLPVDISEPEAWQVELAGAVVDIAADQPIRVRNEDLDRIAALLDEGAESSPAVLRARSSQQVIVVPASAVGSNSDGNLCVWVPAGDAFAAVPVTVVGGSFNTAHIGSGISSATRVLANPGQVLAEPICPST